MKTKASYSLDDIPKNNSISYRDLFNDSRERIKESMDSYRKNIKKLKKTFKSTKQVLFFVEEECLEYKNSIYDLQYRRNLGQENIDRFNQKLNEAIFDDTNSSRSKKIIDISKTLESNRLKLDSFENFNKYGKSTYERIGRLSCSNSKKKICLLSSKKDLKRVKMNIFKF